jgi:hypothetical protein
LPLRSVVTLCRCQRQTSAKRSRRHCWQRLQSSRRGWRRVQMRRLQATSPWPSRVRSCTYSERHPSQHSAGGSSACASRSLAMDRVVFGYKGGRASGVQVRAGSSVPPPPQRSPRPRRSSRRPPPSRQEARGRQRTGRLWCTASTSRWPGRRTPGGRAGRSPPLTRPWTSSTPRWQLLDGVTAARLLSRVGSLPELFSIAHLLVGPGRQGGRRQASCTRRQQQQHFPPTQDRPQLLTHRTAA